MARTSRNGAPSAGTEALDKIDLDDMFADDGLFEGLDIDLDMDDIAGGGGLDSSQNKSAQSGSGLPSRASAPPHPPGEEESVGSSRTRRKTKRKAKTRAFFEDADDDLYDEAPVKKKRKTVKATAASKKKTTPKITPNDTLATATMKPPPAPAATTTKGKGKSTKAVTVMPPPLPLSRGQSTPGSHVAAAGQFGGRQKRGGSFTQKSSYSKASNKLPMMRAASESNVTKSRSTSLPNAAAAAAAATATSQFNAAAHHSHQGQPQQSTYCGLPPSNNLFYPFMPALPTEPAMKSRKVYSAIDRIHSSFASHLHSLQTSTTEGIIPAKESEPIFHLMQEAFKEDKPSTAPAVTTVTQQPAASRSESVGNAIGALRRTITMFDKGRMVGDWYAVCGLLQRQHDFLKQNAENMERWCRDNFSEDDYASVYLPSSRKRKGTDGSAELSILGSFTMRELKVKILCNGFKEPKMTGPLRATLPQLFTPDDKSTEKTAKPTAKTKKRKQPIATAAVTDSKIAELVSPVKAKLPPQPLSYMNMKPTRRRKNVAEMLTRTARELENDYLSRLQVRRRSIDRQEGDLQKLVNQDNLGGIHTMGMWKWLEMSGYFSNLEETEIQQLLDDIRSQEAAITAIDIDKHSDQKRAASIPEAGVSDYAPDESVFDRLQSLLIEEEYGEGSDEDEEDLSKVDFEELYTVTETNDLSQLTLDERAYIHIRSFGLAEKLTVPPVVGTAQMVDGPSAAEVEWSIPIIKFDDASLHNGRKNNAEPVEEVEGDLEDVINAMKTELMRVDEMNNRRAAFLESMSRSSQLFAGDQKRKEDHETSLIAKCQQLLRKSKEMKAKSGAMSKKDDSLALPW